MGLLYGTFLIFKILRKSPGSGKMLEIAEAIQSGAKAYLSRQYKTVGILAVIIVVIMYFAHFSTNTILGFILGAVLSALAGFVGMHISVRTNVRTAEAARHGLSKALGLAFKGGSVTGLFVVSLGLLSVTGFYMITKDLSALIGLAFGSSLISVFARLGGGIFTKGADVGTDMVGKVESNIPEDDPRNPGVIADNVGDNVGDCAGMAADLYETCCVTNIACMVILSIILNTTNSEIIIFPLTITALSIFSTIIALIFIKFVNNNIMDSLYRSFYITIICSIGFIFMYIYIALGWGVIGVYIHYTITGAKLFICSLIGISLTTILI
ncbi:MAG: sodium/proton-translocating pyrophosphatase, partial [Ignavibacteriae bacterium]|nr:sodium/proton-translocating pyrophosphatase [Ignavibacteriota bacterium]